MTRLSVNINKVALLRNARGGNLPDLIQFARDCERFGAQGITVHPRPDERHIRYNDVYDLKEVVKTEFNIEGYPSDRFLALVHEVKPEQCTLVPDAPDVLTSNKGWDTVKQKDFLKKVVAELRKKGIRVSLFVDPIPELVIGAGEINTDRIELFTGHYAEQYGQNRDLAIRDYKLAADIAHDLGIMVNAGHDLNLHNLRYFCKTIPFIAEVSIGHALISDALYFGIENTIQMYLQQILIKKDIIIAPVVL